MTMNTGLNATHAAMFRSRLHKNLHIAFTVENGQVKLMDGTSPLADLKQAYSVLKKARDEAVPSADVRQKNLMARMASGDTRLADAVGLLGKLTGKSPEELAKRFIKEVPISELQKAYDDELAELEGLIEKSIPEDGDGESDGVGCGTCPGCLAAAELEKAMNGEQSFEKNPLDELMAMFRNETTTPPMSQQDMTVLLNFAQSSALAFTKKLTNGIDHAMETGMQMEEAYDYLTNIVINAGLSPSEVYQSYRKDVSKDPKFSTAPDMDSAMDDLGLIDGAVAIPVSALKGMSQQDISNLLKTATANVSGTPKEIAAQLAEALQKALGSNADVKIFHGKDAQKDVEKYVASQK